MLQGDRREGNRPHLHLCSWIKVGFALASLGESGRQFFHLCSSQNEKYDRRETDRKFDNLQKGNGSIKIATFFKICKDYGVSLYH